MSTIQFISVRETAQILAISEKKVMDLIEEETLKSYRIADKFLRLKREEVQALRNKGAIKKETKVHEYTSQERVQDFFYYNDFYLVSLAVILVLMYIIFYT